ncbi:DcaP family trimeric outer membrane transporter [Formosa sp. PL04]|uniref:DcaP family trimeric outer membrane transporter n=1 Tax=Formosa sp. PL04 TaxID=3081755 RepID=UPI002981AA19|nr:DcaP family trimeric outer membrane transporter [Formosa sp. PL04]MDW5289355.1 DcaP family trimeric outer membrane transporter [Formosa sp. PL04]
MKLTLTTFLLCIGFFAFAQDPFLTLTSKDSVGEVPRFKGSLGVNMKLNGYFDIFGGLNDNETFNVGSINVFGTDDAKSLNVDMFQSQIQLKTIFVQENGEVIFAVLESDFWGGEGRMRLRKAYVQSTHWQIGQTWNNFGDEDIWPNIMEWEGPPSGVWLRTPHVKYMNAFSNPNWVYSASLEAPIDTYFAYEEFQPVIGEVDQTTPDLTFAVKYRRDWGHLRVSSVLRSVRYKLNDDIDNFVGYGFTFSGIYKPHKNNFQFQLVGGKGISAYLTTIQGYGYDGYPTHGNQVNATPAFGGWAAYEYYITEKLHTNAVIGFTRFNLDNSERFVVSDSSAGDTVFLKGDFIHQHYYGIFNFMYDPYERMTIGLELDYGVKSIDASGLVNDIDGEIVKSRDAMRVSFGFMYYF